MAMNRFKNILYVAEFAVDQRKAIERVIALAANNQARLTFLQVVEQPRLGALLELYTPEQIDNQLREQERQKLEALLLGYSSVNPVDVQIRVGSPFIEIVRQTLDGDHDLVIKLAADDHGIHDHLFGSTDMHLLRKCPRPVWLMRPEEKTNYAKIMAAVDFDPWSADGADDGLNRRILELASSVALADFAELHLVHVWDSMLSAWAGDIPHKTVEMQIEAERARYQAGLDGLAAKLRHWIGDEAYNYLSPRLHLVRGSARDDIPALAARLDVNLLVMGTVARTGIKGLIIGNTAEVILNGIHCSVLAVKPDGFVSPLA
ncbi:universal stress protein [Methylomonas sp. EFPC1]|uniref:universal stress protein n=1 Tax=Methylomonas sp. EFPC1 TaxID=2812647 RepID=UPI001967A7D3|nr:universal stress protein [Methylomonas sp. EFPC1]QSB01446.1 universal stress protein [Methylomonas sp. EFPC1]